MYPPNVLSLKKGVMGAAAFKNRMTKAVVFAVHKGNSLISVAGKRNLRS